MYTKVKFNYTIIDMKKFIIMLLVSVFCLTIGVCIVKPVMHKQISFAIIDYLIKFNDDGSMTTVKQITTTKLKNEDDK